MKHTDVYTAPMVADFCQVDLKTIHNWVNEGVMTCFRTPGRHLRFRKDELLAFLTKHQFPIPEDLQESPWPSGSLEARCHQDPHWAANCIRRLAEQVEDNLDELGEPDDQ